MSLTVDKSLHWVFSAPWHDTNLKLVLNWLIVPLNWSVYLIFIYELDIDRQPKWLKMDNLEENLSYASFNSARYLILKISCWNSENCKGRTISKSIIYVTNGPFIYSSDLKSAKIYAYIYGESSCRCIRKVLLFSFGKCFRAFWATRLEISNLEQQQFCELVADSALFLISYLVSNCISSRTKQEK